LPPAGPPGKEKFKINLNMNCFRIVLAST